ncbi:nuclear transport factor 2 family protein [Bradyrhizobium japonicum]|uniref:nuclear transport factor 2 family protein n=1 Tax=Bradyrhizobium japonicum TaxID=375 RepID=UPI0006769AEA|nr:nuclear transport factor 2 family protein [Bradyrhizobium japonicum]
MMAWSIDSWRNFWANPSIDVARKRVPTVVSPEVVGYWPSIKEPVRGTEMYLTRVVQFLTLIPDLRLKLEEHATSGSDTFLRWSATGRGPDGPLEFNGVDRIRLKDGLVIENRVISDHQIFRSLENTIV